jgi:hypothetical protein
MLIHGRKMFVLCLLFKSSLILGQPSPSVYLFDERLKEAIPVVSDLQALSGANTAWIMPHASPVDDKPVMPQLKVRLTDDSVAGPISWQLKVVYRRPNGRALPEDTVVVRSKQNDQAVETKVTTANGFWKIYEDYPNEELFGGLATLTYRVNIGEPHDVFFWIAGKNPDWEKCRNFIISEDTRLQGYSRVPIMWYADCIAREETEDEGAHGLYNQFCASGQHDWRMTKHPGSPNWNDDGYIRGTNTRKVGGFGLMQVTGWMGNENGDVPRDVIWNWKSNITAGLEEILREHLLPSWRYMAELRRIAQKPVPRLIVANVTFEDGSNHTIEDAVTIKAYNGSSMSNSADPDDEPNPRVWFYTGRVPASGKYCYWDAKNKRWALSRYNTLGFNYVEKVCRFFQP